jgi:hypothetical protein
MAIYSGFTHQKQMVIFHSYVSLPEGIPFSSYEIWEIWGVSACFQLFHVDKDGTMSPEKDLNETPPGTLTALQC